MYTNESTTINEGSKTSLIERPQTASVRVIKRKHQFNIPTLKKQKMAVNIKTINKVCRDLELNMCRSE